MFHFYVRTYAKNICMHHICIYVQMQTCFASYANVYVRTYVRTCRCTYECIYVLRIYVSTYLCICEPTHLSIYGPVYSIIVSMYLCIFASLYITELNPITDWNRNQHESNVTWIYTYTNKAQNHSCFSGPFFFKHHTFRKVESLVSHKTSNLTK